MKAIKSVSATEPSATNKRSNSGQRVVLCILDGWGWREAAADNAISLARTPHWQRLLADCQLFLLEASEQNVGLPAHQMGNSEVGHMNIGAGRIVYQDLLRINASIADGSMARNPILLELVKKLQASGGTAHIFGLFSDGGVHSELDHLIFMARHLATAGIAVALHLATDGRDTPPQSAGSYLGSLPHDQHLIKVATVMGRYWAMDRNQNWGRQQRAFAAMVEGQADYRAQSAEAAIAMAYDRKEDDEFLQPTVIGDYQGMVDGDGLVIVNYRADRVRQLLASLVEPQFNGFAPARRVRFAATATMTEYSTELARLVPAFFAPLELTETLGQVVAQAGLKQLRLAETEKYPHVSFFFNGGREEPFAGESRLLIPSPDVATYDLRPEMAAAEVTTALVAAIVSQQQDLIVVNYANGDMVGHSGIIAAAVKAVEAVDQALGAIRAAVEATGAALIVTADHGNVEMMQDPISHKPHTAHSLNPVPLLVVNGRAELQPLTDRHGRLADIAPTVLALMGLAQPTAMTGKSLVTKALPNSREVTP
ncbi:MAG: 2,3-bisphosphoglycerate-independent phosphoglycerate mutase [Candidatus Pacebacteria bacterium]|nr:2,3-bisphosphoglycerate-independent phosphoglycerate mutase [Candidatus Paceibacterota bacterium]